MAGNGAGCADLTRGAQPNHARISGTYRSKRIRSCSGLAHFATGIAELVRLYLGDERSIRLSRGNYQLSSMPWLGGTKTAEGDSYRRLASTPSARPESVPSLFRQTPISSGKRRELMSSQTTGQVA